ncbi:MAG: InlB B-repeat-containing protein [Limisphaerales bacterium]
MKYQLKQLLICVGIGCAVTLFAQSNSNPPGTVIVDNPAAELDGPWTTSKSTVDKFGDDYAWASTVAAARPSATATYRPRIPTAGKYNVDVWYSAGENRSPEAKWLLSFDGGKEEVTINQRTSGGRWVSLAKEKPFAAGNAGFVQLVNVAPTGAVVVADAVRFVPVAGTTTTGNAGFTLNVTAAYGGTVATSPNQGSFERNAVATLTAKASDGYVFNGWSGDASGWKNPLRVTMNTNKTITANFIAAGVGVIMDNPTSEKKGSWQTSSTAWAGTWYDDYDFSVAKPIGDATATYRPHIPKTGKYDVYIRYAQGSNRSTKVPWTVSHKGGVVNAIVNQQTKGGEWFQIASGVEFTQGKQDKQFAQVSNGTGPESAGTVVVADAVAFVYIGD